MLPRKHRISKNLFPLIRKNKLIEGEVFSLRVTYLDNKKNDIRFVCIISKKTEKFAVNRNKVKRQVYSIMLENIESLNKSIYIQIFPKKNAFQKTFSCLKKDLETILNKI